MTSSDVPRSGVESTFTLFLIWILVCVYKPVLRINDILLNTHCNSEAYDTTLLINVYSLVGFTIRKWKTYRKQENSFQKLIPKVVFPSFSFSHFRKFSQLGTEEDTDEELMMRSCDSFTIPP